MKNIDHGYSVLKAIFRILPNIAFVKNKEFVYIAASEQFAKMVGKESASEIVGKTDYEIFEESLAKKHRMEDDWKIVHEKNSVVNDVQFGFGKDIESF